MADIYVTDYGIPHEITITKNGVAQDISDATLMVLTYRKSTGQKITKTPVFKTDGTNGIIVYTFQAGDIAAGEHGTWTYQAYIETVTSGKHTQHGTLEVGSNL